ncbi:MAG: 50S ribosomal protein L10 [Chloroflexi bacterium]|nr:50S ribosomal protein L10 [Chloroflexota bacterium]
MPTEKKKAIVSSLIGKLSGSHVVLTTDYRGLSVGEITELRHKLREFHIDLHVVKNTLACLAAEKTGRDALVPMLKGPTALVFGLEDEVQLARVLSNCLRTAKTPFRIKGGILDNQALSPDDVSTLSTLPPKNELLRMLLGSLQTPIARLIFVLNSQTYGLIGVLQSRLHQLEEATA